MENEHIEFNISELLKECNYPLITDNLCDTLMENEFIVSVANFYITKSFVSERQANKVLSTTIDIHRRLEPEMFKDVVSIHISKDGVKLLNREEHIKDSIEEQKAILRKAVGVIKGLEKELETLK